MNVYIRTWLVLAVGVAAVGVALQEVIRRYEAEISVIFKENPTLKATSQVIQGFFPVHKLLFPIVAYFPSLGDIFQPSPQPSPDTITPSKKTNGKLFTPELLRKYDGKGGNKGPYLAILGKVYNVKKGRKHYGPGGGYEFFSGRDASRAFVSGDFTEAGLIDDVSGLSTTDYIGLDEWIKFYGSDYSYVGKLIGRYYDANGEATPYNYDAQRWISEAYVAKEKDNLEKKMFPPCNSEWNPDSGSRLWCTRRSGGIERAWTGVPRQLFTPGKAKPRCACVKNVGPPSHDPRRVDHRDRGDLDHPNLQEYPNCVPDQPECFVKFD